MNVKSTTNHEITWIESTDQLPLYLVVHATNKRGITLTKMYRAIESATTIPE